ncbi:MAG: ATP-dependent Clp protease adapter ClpS [Candidatus Obscuribacterales bacterium]|nr:ATP-dependent Clp protease adapter ClpS [Cyanobacteria bacterium HKST-UBA01]MCB9471755.1 ATP-dependent Clp protease adapter ClpS [Candidatus Obscuribacterales bacterium]
MSNWDPSHQTDHEEKVVTKTKKKVKKPPLYKVLLHNDDFTTMEFVVQILMTVFHKKEEDATMIMLAVHMQGMGVAGVYTHEIAQEKVNRVMTEARNHDFPLLCTMEPE